MKILAAIDGSPISGAVLDTAANVAAVLPSATVEALHIGPQSDPDAAHAAAARDVPLRTLAGPVVDRLHEACEDPEIAALVVGAEGMGGGGTPAGHVTRTLMVSATRPLIVVPAGARPSRPIHRVLVALDEAAATNAALAPLLGAAQDAELDLVVLHVLDAERTPAFTDQPHHWAEAFAHEFRARHLGDQDMTLELRSGDPATRLLDVAAEQDADLVGLAWSQSLAPGRAAVVQAAVQAGDIPILLVPLHHPEPPASGPPAAGAARSHRPV